MHLLFNPLLLKSLGRPKQWRFSLELRGFGGPPQACCICRIENYGLRSNWCFDCYYNTTICYCVMNKLDKFIELIVL